MEYFNVSSVARPGKEILKKKILFVVNTDDFFLSHRLPIAVEVLNRGFEVHLLAGMTKYRHYFESLGIVVHSLPIISGSYNPISNIKTFFRIFLLILKIKPDIAHFVTIKPVLFGGIISQVTKVPFVVVSISGLGFVFTSKGKIAQLRRLITDLIYKLALRHKNMRVIFQNHDDLFIIKKITGLDPDKAILIKGSGVDLNLYKPSPLPEGTPILMLPARLLFDKGVKEFVEAARILKKEGLKARFVLVGRFDKYNPSRIPRTTVDSWLSENIIEYWGFKEDVAKTFSKAKIIILPSYREGLPKVLLEAAACGRPSITTDVPGCRDAIIPRKTGFIVPAKDPKSLAKMIKYALDNENMLKKMSTAARKLAEKSFNIQDVIQMHIEIYNAAAK